jgi:hypothetical protein
MHTHRQRQERQIRQVRGAMHEAMRGSVLGCEHGCAEGVGEAEAIRGSHIWEMVALCYLESKVDWKYDSKRSNVRYGYGWKG